MSEILIAGIVGAFAAVAVVVFGLWHFLKYELPEIAREDADKFDKWMRSQK